MCDFLLVLCNNHISLSCTVSEMISFIKRITNASAAQNKEHSTIIQTRARA